MMKEYKVDTISTVWKTRNGFEEALQKLIDERVAQGYTLHTLNTTIEVTVAVFEREADGKGLV